jgi:hypothetical protein
MKWTCRVAGIVVLVSGTWVVAGPPATNPIPLDAHGFAAGQSLQKAYVKSLQDAKKPPKVAAEKPAAPKPAPAQTKTIEAASTRSPNAVVVASSPPGGNPPGSFRRGGDTSAAPPAPQASPTSSSAGAVAPARNPPSLGERVRAMFSRTESGSPAK